MTRTGSTLWAVAAAIAVAHVGCKHSGTAAAAGGSTDAGVAQQAAPVDAAAQRVATPTPAANQVDGRIEAIDRGNNVTLAGSEAVGHAFDRFKVDSDTRITVNGRQADLAELHEGDDVRASFSTSDGELHVDRLDVVAPSDVSGSGETR